MGSWNSWWTIPVASFVIVFQPFWFCLADRHTHTHWQTRMNAILPQISSAWIIIMLTRNQKQCLYLRHCNTGTTYYHTTTRAHATRIQGRIQGAGGHAPPPSLTESTKMRHFGIKIQKNSGEGAQSPPQTSPLWGGGTPPQTPPTNPGSVLARIYACYSENHNNTCAENRKIRGFKFDTL